MYYYDVREIISRQWDEFHTEIQRFSVFEASSGHPSKMKKTNYVQVEAEVRLGTITSSWAERK